MRACPARSRPDAASSRAASKIRTASSASPDQYATHPAAAMALPRAKVFRGRRVSRVLSASASTVAASVSRPEVARP